jgi:hypothetical protein
MLTFVAGSATLPATLTMFPPLHSSRTKRGFLLSLAGQQAVHDDGTDSLHQLSRSRDARHNSEAIFIGLFFAPLLGLVVVDSL